MRSEKLVNVKTEIVTRPEQAKMQHNTHSSGFMTSTLSALSRLRLAAYFQLVTEMTNRDNSKSHSLVLRAMELQRNGDWRCAREKWIRSSPGHEAGEFSSNCLPFRSATAALSLSPLSR